MTTEEKSIGQGYGGFPLFPYRMRKYKCADCGNEVVIGTNHHVDCYPVCKGKCRLIINPHTSKEVVLPKQTAHNYIGEIEELPEVECSKSPTGNHNFIISMEDDLCDVIECEHCGSLPKKP